MRLSEAMMLGGMSHEVNPFNWRSCLLGVSVQALGKINKGTNEEALSRWPWITERVPVPAIYRQHYPSIQYATAQNIISNMAMWVCIGEMTLDQAAGWVRSVEPSEPRAEVLVSENTSELVGSGLL